MNLNIMRKAPINIYSREMLTNYIFTRGNSKNSIAISSEASNCLFVSDYAFEIIFSIEIPNSLAKRPHNGNWEDNSGLEATAVSSGG